MKEIIITNEATINAEGNLHSKHCKSVIAIKKDGSEVKIFSSIQDAAELLGINANYISTRMNSDMPCKGWEFIPMKRVLSVVDKIVDVCNRNATDAQKWQAQEAEKERIRLEEERKQREIAKAKEKVAKLETDAEKYRSKWYDTVAALNNAYAELDNLLNDGEEVA